MSIVTRPIPTPRICSHMCGLLPSFYASLSWPSSDEPMPTQWLLVGSGCQLFFLSVNIFRPAFVNQARLLDNYCEFHVPCIPWFFLCSEVPSLVLALGCCSLVAKALLSWHLGHPASHRCCGPGSVPRLVTDRMCESCCRYPRYLPWVGGFFRVLWFPPPLKRTFHHHHHDSPPPPWYDPGCSWCAKPQ